MFFYLERERDAAPLAKGMINHAGVFIKLQPLWDPTPHTSPAVAQSTPPAKWHWTSRQGRATSASVLIRGTNTTRYLNTLSPELCSVPLPMQSVLRLWQRLEELSRALILPCLFVVFN